MAAAPASACAGEGGGASLSLSHAHRSPIYSRLLRGSAYRSALLEVRYCSPDNWEPLYCRLQRRDPAAGCIDPEVRKRWPACAPSRSPLACLLPLSR